jgi:hypothetical protein
MNKDLSQWDEDAFWRKLILPKRTEAHLGRGKVIDGFGRPMLFRSSSGGRHSVHNREPSLTARPIRSGAPRRHLDDWKFPRAIDE